MPNDSYTQILWLHMSISLFGMKTLVLTILMQKSKKTSFLSLSPSQYIYVLTSPSLFYLFTSPSLLSLHSHSLFFPMSSLSKLCISSIAPPYISARLGTYVSLSLYIYISFFSSLHQSPHYLFSLSPLYLSLFFLRNHQAFNNGFN